MGRGRDEGAVGCYRSDEQGAEFAVLEVSGCVLDSRILSEYTEVFRSGGSEPWGNTVRGSRLMSGTHENRIGVRF